LIDGDVKLTQSSAILHHIARKVKLDGATDEEKRRIDVVEAEFADLKQAYGGICYTPEFVRVQLYNS